MRTQIKGKDSPWTQDILDLWEKVFKDHLPNLEKKYEKVTVTQANYFTPRPYNNEYDRGSDDFGFVYTVNGRHVYIVSWKDWETP